MKFLKFGVRFFFVEQLWLSQHLLVQSPQEKHQNNVYMFKVNNKEKKGDYYKSISHIILLFSLLTLNT